MFANLVPVNATINAISSLAAVQASSPAPAPVQTLKVAKASVILGLALGAFALSLASPARATLITLTTADGLFGADTFLNGGGEILAATGRPRRDSNFGNENRLVVKFTKSGGNSNDLDFDSNNTRISLLRFDLSSITGTVTAASLKLGVRQTELNADNVPADVSVGLGLLRDATALDAAPTGGGWDETGITMNNSVLANVFPIGSFPGAIRVPGVALGTTGATATFDGNAALNSILGDTNDLITFVILPQLNSPQGIQFFSKENLEGGLFPTLELEVTGGITPVPLPGTLVLFGSGLVGLFFMRRRR